MPSKGLRVIDLFAGMGGFRIAFQNNGCQCVFSSEIDKNACNTYELNFGEQPSGDITKIDAKDIPEFDILCAGFPCQPFSIAGRRLGFEDTRGTLFFDVVRILKEKKPSAFLLENVKGLVSHNNGKTLDTIVNTLHEIGYNLKWQVLNAKDYGVPQNRERWYCIGILKEIASEEEIVFPNKKKLEYDLRDIISDGCSDEYKVSMKCSKNIDDNLKSKGIEINAFSLAYEIRPSRCQIANNYISPCLTAKMGTGGNNVPVVISQKRKLTEKECLQIMGFPNDYKIKEGYQSYKQIGNSVVVPILQLLAQEVCRLLKKGGNK